MAQSILVVVLSIYAAFGQTPDAPGPKRPLRERLLERALQGDRVAQFDLGKDYEGGRIGLPQDLFQAAHWYRESANRGDPFAEASLGIFYNFGKGVGRDHILAYMWFERSASHLTGGDRDTVIEMRDSVAHKLTPGQIEKARRLAKEPEPDARH